jgi:hypothetical protein
MVKHIDTWFAFARDLGLVHQMEEIILVTGCDLTRSWTNVAFLGEADAQVSFGVKVEGPNTSINFQFSPEHVRGAVLHHGPEGTVRTMFETISDCVTALTWPCRTCPKINVYSSEDFVSLLPYGSCQSVSKRPLVPLQTQEGTTVIQT